MNQQEEKNFFAVIQTGKNGLVDMTQKRMSDIMGVAAKNVKDAGNAWIQRAIISISSDAKLMQVASTNSGLFSIYKALLKAATMGLQLGGQFQQAYMVPYGDTVELIPTRDGYKQAATNGPGAVLANFEIGRVYDGEDVKINPRTGDVEHIITTSVQRGKLKGVYGIMTRTDGEKRADYMTREEALKIRDSHSRAFSNGKNSPWHTDEDAMIEKTAAKKFLRPYAAESEGLAMLYASDDPGEYESTPVDVSERVSSRINKNLEKAEKIETVQTIEDVPETVNEPEAIF